MTVIVKEKSKTKE